MVRTRVKYQEETVYARMKFKISDQALNKFNEITNNNNANIILTSHSKAEMLKFHKEIFV